MKRLSLVFLFLALLMGVLALSVNATLSPAVGYLSQDAVLVKAARMGETVTFCDADFRRLLGVTSYPSVTLTTLPDPCLGVLKLNGLRVSQGQTVAREQISRLTFTPATHLVKSASFSFRVGNLCGGATLTCSMLFSERANLAPTCGDGEEPCFSFVGGKNISVFGSLSAYDPEGDALTYLIVSFPKKGSLTLTDKTSGAFRYTPRVSYEGTDTFTYVVRDCYGAYSAPTTVTIRIKGGAFDTDSDELPSSHAEATEAYLALRGVIPSDKAGEITKGEFLAAAMRAAGVFPTSGKQTVLDNNADIPEHLRPAISTAISMGIISPTYRAGELIFDWAAPITCEEALATLARLLPDYTLPAAWQSTPADVPLTWPTASPLLYDVATLPQ